MRILNCSVCKKKSFKFINDEPPKLNLDDNHVVLDIHKCKKCCQNTIVAKDTSINKVNYFWLEFYNERKNIEKIISEIEIEIETLNKIKQISPAMKRKMDKLNESYETHKLKKENLRYTMLASMSIKLQSVL